jgi:GntR family transcriptional regulator/MocR family aminotransferase
MKVSTDTLALFAADAGFKEIGTPQYQQLVDLIKNMLSSSLLVAGQMLPSTRELAQHMGISRKTVLRAYEELICQGYFDTERGIGTFVALTPLAPLHRQPSSNLEFPLSHYGKNIVARTANNTAVKHAIYDQLRLLNFGAGPAELLPVKQWRQCLLEFLRNFNWEDLDFEFAPGRPSSLEAAISEYLFRARGVTIQEEQKLVTFTGSRNPIFLLSKLLLNHGDHVAVENPGFPYARAVFQELGCQITGIPVDEEGLIIEALEGVWPLPKLIYVTPSHDPTGATLSLRRREALVKFAQEKKIIIVEDDYDYEFDSSYSRQPTLLSLAAPGQVLYISCFWKTLYPLVTLGYMVLPENLAQTFIEALHLPENPLPAQLPCLEEATLTRFLKSGMLERHIHKITPVYMSRHRALRSALTKHLGGKIKVAKNTAGMHLCVNFGDLTASENFVLSLADQGDLAMVSTASYYINPSEKHEYLLPFGHMNEEAIEKAVCQFSQKLKENHLL